MAEHDADLIIVGAGCAGLSALAEIMRSDWRDRRILLVDRDLGPRDDRTWSFWGAADAPYADLADGAWDALRVRFPNWESTQRLRGAGGRRRYLRVRSRDYSAAILARAARRPNIEFVEQPVVGFEQAPGAGSVLTGAGELRAPVVLQSVALSPTDAAATARHPLRQHFGGWEVRTARPVFDPGVVTLMDFDTDQGGATAFAYVLPDAPDRALVEHTVFSRSPHPPAWYDHRIEAHLDRFGAGDVTVERSEYGVIPMEDRRLHQRWGPHIWNLGTVGGMTKPTTGYTFQRIHAQTRHLVASLVAGAPRPFPSAPARYRFADRTLLNILDQRPELGRPIFERLFRTTPIDAVLTFLDEASTRRADLRMISQLPWGPFVAAALEETAAPIRPARDDRSPVGRPGLAA